RRGAAPRRGARRVNPATHALIGWAVANVAPSLPRRERAIAFFGSLVPDLDGLTLLGGHELFEEWHRKLCHNVLFAALSTAAAVALARSRRGLVAALFLVNFHLHLLCDYWGSASPPDPVTHESRTWTIPYFLPFSDFRFDNPRQWALNAWPNFLITFLFAALAVWIARRYGRTPVEPFSLRAEAAVLETLRRRFDGPRAGG
ncbi:MAG TPA: metal-dependent hydrolase, partial [Planctomycetota bacterium]|nr:metal-dependent hydrolase [Planctomycetota bacterium]